MVGRCGRLLWQAMLNRDAGISRCFRAGSSFRCHAGNQRCGTAVRSEVAKRGITPRPQQRSCGSVEEIYPASQETRTSLYCSCRIVLHVGWPQCPEENAPRYSLIWLVPLSRGWKQQRINREYAWREPPRPALSSQAAGGGRRRSPAAPGSEGQRNRRQCTGTRTPPVRVRRVLV